VVMLSDTHAHHEDVDVPAGDVLIHCGGTGHAGSRKCSVVSERRSHNSLDLFVL
jgi:hypothetical protein